jgi:hypothetical protein
LLKDLEPNAVRESAPIAAFALLKRMKAMP